MAKSGGKVSFEEAKQSALKFFEKQKKFKEIQAKFNEVKAQFNGDMSLFFENEQIEKSIMLETGYNQDLQINRIQKSSVEFNADKLEKALGKELARDVVLKRYEIIDFPGLVAYLKEFGVEPSVFKSFLNVTKTVDEKELDKLEELGKIDIEQIKGCYTVKQHNPYFTVAVKRGQSDDERQD